MEKKNFEDKIAKAKYQFETGTSKVLQKKVIENIILIKINKIR